MGYLENADFIAALVFWISNPKSILGKFGLKKSKLLVLRENWHVQYLKDADSYFDVSFLKFQT